MNEKNVKTATNDYDEIDPVIGEVVIEGVACNVKRLKTKQLFALVRLIRKMSEGELQGVGDVTDIMTDKSKLINVLFLSLDRAEAEFYELICSLLKIPEDKEKEIYTLIRSGELGVDELTDVIVVFIEQEAPSFGELIKKVRAAVARMGPLLPIVEEKK